jgi:hypothetical protein
MGSTHVEAPPAPVINFPEAPEPRSYAEETRDTLQAQIDLAPDVYRAESTYRPRYAELDASIFRNVLGSPGSGGMLDYYENILIPAQTRMQTSSNRSLRESDVADIATLGPQVREAMKQAVDPSQRALLDMMTQQATQDLAARGRLTPDEERYATQQARQGWEDRGLVRSDGAVLAELVNNEMMRKSREDRARAFADQVLRENITVYGDPFMSVLGRQSSAPQQALGTQAANAGWNQGNALFNPESGYAGNLYGQNYGGALNIWGTQAASLQDQAMTQYNAQAAAGIATANNRGSLMGAGIGALGSLGGGFLSSL